MEVTKNGRTYQVYRPGGDITVGHGTWLLTRYHVKTDRHEIISNDAPGEWLTDADNITAEILEKESAS